MSIEEAKEISTRIQAATDEPMRPLSQQDVDDIIRLKTFRVKTMSKQVKEVLDKS